MRDVIAVSLKHCDENGYFFLAPVKTRSSKSQTLSNVLDENGV